MPFSSTGEISINVPCPFAQVIERLWPSISEWFQRKLKVGRGQMGFLRFSEWSLPKCFRFSEISEIF